MNSYKFRVELYLTELVSGRESSRKLETKRITRRVFAHAANLHALKSGFSCLPEVSWHSQLFEEHEEGIERGISDALWSLGWLSWTRRWFDWIREAIE